MYKPPTKILPSKDKSREEKDKRGVHLATGPCDLELGVSSLLVPLGVGADQGQGVVPVGHTISDSELLRLLRVGVLQGDVVTLAEQRSYYSDD